MAENVFTKVKQAIPSHADAILAEFGIKHQREGTKLKGDWTTGFLCPLCGDKSGSASFTHQLYLKCHQCSAKADVFDWLSRYTGRKTWELCQELAQRCNVSLPKTKRAAGKSNMPPRMTEEVWNAAVEDLWTHKDAEGAREMLRLRGVADPVVLTEAGVGWIKGWIVFVSRDEHGRLLDRYRGWQPSNPKLKWMWFGPQTGSGGVGIWPTVPPEEGHRIWLAEGEGDVLTALARLRMRDQGWTVCTWTAGAGSPLRPRDVPRWFHGREVHVGYDNDVFQGPDYDRYFVETKPGKNPNQARLAMETRLRNLLEKVVPTLQSLGCNVMVRQCPVDPKEKYGGDLRDWVDAGGRDLAEWPAFDPDELPRFGIVVVDVAFSEVFHNLHKRIRVRCQVDAIARDDMILSNVFEMKCEMGQHPACSNCPGARSFPDGMIDMIEYQRELAVGLEQKHVSDKIIRDVVQKPKNCPRLEVVPVEVRGGSEWKAGPPGKMVDSTQRTLHVFSPEPPSLSGEMEIEGIAYPNARGDGVVFLATSVKHLDGSDIDLTSTLTELREACPSFSDDIEDIDRFFEKRHRDLAYHVTKIHGRRDIHIAHDLLMHSAYKAVLFGAEQRAWLDITVFGNTRTGKSLTFRRLWDFHGLGQHTTAVSNLSRAGLLMGADRQGMLKPGALPRANRKAYMIDEFHFLVKNLRDDHPMTWLQSARDEGVASGVKIYGSRELPAAVRLLTVANWMGDQRKRFQFECEHLLGLYGSPETISRLDFALVVANDPEQSYLDKVPQFWTKELTRSLIQRAWAMEPHQIIIDPEAENLARHICYDWQDRYHNDQLPLFTVEEKPYCLLRIAIAVANAVMSHPKDDFYSCWVRPVHVEWAANWLMHTWRVSSYDVYCQTRTEAQRVANPFEVEKLLTIKTQLDDFTQATVVLSGMLTPFTLQDVSVNFGIVMQEALPWIGKLIGLRAIERCRSGNVVGMTYQLTQGGRQIVENLIRLAETNPEEWVRRWRAMRTWSDFHVGVQNKKDPDDLVPMNGDVDYLFQADGDVPF